MLKDDLRNTEAKWSDKQTVVDGNWVSSRQPNGISTFNQAILELF
ncbi:MAG TPA: DJ-1/PfpI family protein [Candidatus Acidoferrum sp.]|nr:DJ-1/PfpI family protein [Candidatus Acidoferrum sp.]